jgi:uncharacterized membrane protein
VRACAKTNTIVEVTTMSQAAPTIASSIVAVYPDHQSAERAVRLLHEEGIAMGDLSIVGRDFQTTEEPIGFVSSRDYARAGAATGAWFGGLFGLCVGAAFLVLPGLGPVVVAGPLTAAVVAGIEGALCGTALGSLAGALVGWGIPREKALKYEKHVKGGKFLVVVRGEPPVVTRARKLLGEHKPEQVDVFNPASASYVTH